MKKIKAPKTAHTSNSKLGMGDYYGTGYKAPLGKIREDFGIPKTMKKKIKTPPKKLA